jgi:quinoprotein glucose dehydrogenase
MYVYSQSQLRLIGLTNDHDPQRSDMAYLASGGGFPLEVQGLPLIKPPWGRITAIDLNEGEIVWQVAHGETPEFVQNHPALQGIDLPRTGRIANAGGSSGGIGTLVTQTLVISGEGGTANGRVYGPPAPGRGAKLYAYDKGTGEEMGAISIPAMQTGSPMTYMLQGKQYLVLAVGGGSDPGQLIAFSLP